MDCGYNDAIQKKINLNKPYFATRDSVKKTVTDFNTFPYTYWYRGKTGSSSPIVIDRKAGWRPRFDDVDDCYKIIPSPMPEHEHGVCFQYPCTTVLRCKTRKQRCFPGGWV